MRINLAPPVALQRNTQLMPESIDSLGRVRQTYRALTETVPDGLRRLTRRVAGVIEYYWYRARGDNPRHTAAAHADREICQMVNAHLPMEAGVRLEQHVGRSVRLAWGRAGVRPLAELDRLDDEIDFSEERLQTRRLTSLGATTPQMLREEAQACWKSSAVYAERAVALEEEADRFDHLSDTANRRVRGGAQ
jgi:hypothetical protein